MAVVGAGPLAECSISIEAAEAAALRNGQDVIRFPCIAPLNCLRVEQTERANALIPLPYFPPHNGGRIAPPTLVRAVRCAPFWAWLFTHLTNWPSIFVALCANNIPLIHRARFFLAATFALSRLAKRSSLRFWLIRLFAGLFSRKEIIPYFSLARIGRTIQGFQAHITPAQDHQQ